MAAHRKSDQRRDDPCVGELHKRASNVAAVGIRYQRFKKVDARQRFSLRIAYEETIHSFLCDVDRGCSGLLRSG